MPNEKPSSISAVDPSVDYVHQTQFRGGWWTLPAAGRVITSELLAQIQQELDDEEVDKANRLARGEPL